MRLTTCLILLLQTPSEDSRQSIGITQGASKVSTHTVTQHHFGYLCASDNPSNVIGLRTASLEVDKGNIWTIATVVNNSVIIPNKKSPSIIKGKIKSTWIFFNGQMK